MTTVTASTTLGIDLNPARFTSPVVIDAGVTVSNPLYPYTVYRHSGATTFFVIDNNGTIASDSGIGVYLAPGGSVINAASASITNSRYGEGSGVEISGGAGTVDNEGSITGGLHGVYLSLGGSVTNGASAYIEGFLGVYVSGNPGTVVNEGSITGSNFGVDLSFGGSVTNGASGHIAGPFGVGGVIVSFRPGTVVNEGTIYGVDLVSGGSVTNAASGSIVGVTGGVVVDTGHGIVVNDGIIEGLYGVGLFTAGTLTNAGSIIGNNGTAAFFGGTGGNRLVLDPGFGFSGYVFGSASATNTMELASAAPTGTVTGLGSQFQHFGSIAFDPGARWFASGVQRGLAGPISGFARGDTIEMSGYTAIGSSFATGILTLDLAGGGTATLDLPGTFTSASDFGITNVAAGADVTVACFVAGIRILTSAGEVPVEDLRVGDHVVTLHGRRLAPVVWLGHRYLDCLRHPRPDDVRPICVKADAIGNGVPHRDLWLSPEHAVLMHSEAGDVLVPIRHLLNGTSIEQVPCASVTYWHVELTSHDVILAEGLATETYLDTGNRSDFANGGPAAIVYPTFADAVWRARACAPQLRHGDSVAALQHRLAERAVRSGGVQHMRSQIR